MADHDDMLPEARLRARRLARASHACVAVAASVALAAMATYLHGWRSGWPAMAILCVVGPAALALAVSAIVFDRILDARYRVEVAIVDAEIASMVRDTSGDV